MIVAIDGPQSSGKTTCFESLKTHPLLVEDVNFVPEVARPVAARFGVIAEVGWNHLLADRAQARRFFDAELEALQAQQTPPAIVDSSALLVTAYMRVFLDSADQPPSWAVYDTIFLCEPWGLPVADGFRFAHRQGDVLQAYRELIAELGLSSRVVELAADTNRLARLAAHPVWDSIRTS